MNYHKPNVSTSFANKDEMRNLVLDILAGRKGAQIPENIKGLASRVCENLHGDGVNQQDQQLKSQIFGSNGTRRLDEQESAMLLEIYWDLFREKYISLGMNLDNPETTRFSIHSEAPEFLKSGLNPKS